VASFEPATIALISRPFVVEVLAALQESDHTLDSLRRCCRTRRRGAMAALRALTAAGAVARRGAAGSWDLPDRDDTRYTLTVAGHRLVDELGDVDRWVDAFRATMR
jgi:hypothetical protein